MERPLDPYAFLVAALLAMLVALGGSVLLPHERYYRYQAHSSGTTRKADWIYERLHFDKTPVDVALIGTSRMAGGLSPALIESEYCRATGRRIHVANLAIPETGRNMHYVLAKEAARTKRPAVFVVELNEVESRRPHAGFIVLADAREVLTAPAFLNANYFADLIRLPGRQAGLFYESVLRRPAVRPSFDPADYAGPYLDRTKTIAFLDGRALDKSAVKPKAELDALFAARRRAEAPLHAFPPFLRRLEYRFSRRYLAMIERVANEGGGQVDYAYFPAYRAPQMPAALMDELKVRPAIDLGGPAANDPSFWHDATHLNARGAQAASRRFAAGLAAQHRLLGRPGACVNAG